MLRLSIGRKGTFVRTRVHGRKDVRPLSLQISKSLPFFGGSLGKRCFPFESGTFLQTC